MEYIELELRSVEHQGAHETGGAPRGEGAPPPSWTECGPPGLHLLPVFFIFSKSYLCGFSGHSENFCFLHNKQHHGSCAENSAGLVSFKSCKLESKTRAKVFGKVDTLEMYQLSILEMGQMNKKRQGIIVSIIL